MAASPTALGPLPAIDILVEAGDWPATAELAALAEKVVGAAVRTLRPPLAHNSELSLVFTDDAHIRELNYRYRSIDSATNVLTFPSPEIVNSGHALLGDIVLAHETVLAEAQSRGLTIVGHIAHLILHGFLHILGYDHLEEAEALAMERLETGILDDLGIADPHVA